jgi:RNA polymerase sigma factor (sigma-70 family)
MNDPELLHSYARDNSQDAFAALVNRYVNLVYSAAQRQVRSPQLAEEVAQSVFIDLARNAAKLRPDQPLAAWLFLVTRRTAVDVVRRESRRQIREQIAVEIADMKTPSHTWAQVKDLVDEAIESLNDSERSAILLRFFENRSLREVGDSLGISEDTAQKRVSRALERLRTFFLRRGVIVTAAGLATDLGANAVAIAPAALASTINAVTTSTVSSGPLAVATMTTLHKSAAAFLIASLASLGVYEGFKSHRQRDQLPQFNANLGALSASREHVGRTPANNQAPRPASPAASDTALGTPSPEQRVTLLRQLFDELPSQRLPELRLLDPDEWLAIARKHELDNSADIRTALAELRAIARRKIAEVIQDALRRYTSTSNGQPLDDITQLTPFLSAPADAEMLARYAPVHTGRLSDSSEKLVREKATSDLILAVGLEGWSITNNSDLPAAAGESEAIAIARAMQALGTATGDDDAEQSKQAASLTLFAASVGDAMKSLGDNYGAEMKRAAAAFVAAHPNETVTDVAQMLPFLKNSEKLIAAFRPVFAQLDYAREHEGQSPTRPDQWQPYLSRPFFAAEAFRAMKLTRDGDRLDLDFDFPANVAGKP